MTKPKEVEKIKFPPIVFDATEAKANELVKKYSNLIIVDTKTEDSTRKACAELRTIRTGIPKAITAWWAPYKLQHDAAKAMGAKLLAITQPTETYLKSVIDAWEAKKEERRKEKARLAKEREDFILAAIENISTRDADLSDSTSKEIEVDLKDFQSIVVDDTYAEWQGAAGQAKGALIARTELLLEKVRAQEKADEERKVESERLAKQKEEQDKIQKELDEKLALIEKAEADEIAKEKGGEKEEEKKESETVGTQAFPIESHNVQHPVQVLITKQYLVEMDPKDIKGKTEAEITALALNQFIALEEEGASMDENAIAMTAVIYEPEEE